MVSVLGEYSYDFPKPQKLDLVMKDLLEKDVDESFYLKTESARKFILKNLENADIDKSLLRERERMAHEVRTDATGNASQISSKLSADYRWNAIEFI